MASLITEESNIMQRLDTVSDAPLRVGIMVNSLTCPRWIAKVMEDIQSSSFARIVIVVLNGASTGGPKRGFRQRLRTYWTHSLFERYRHWDRARHRANIDAFEDTNVATTLNGIPILTAKPVQKGFVDRFTPEDIALIRAANLDVLFRFGFRIIRGEILSCAKHGIWSFHHGDNREYRGAPPGFWEMYEQNPVTGSILQILTEELDGGRVIYRSLSATDFRSLYLTLNPLYWKTAAFALRRLRDLHRFGWSFLSSLEEFNEPDSYKKVIYRTPDTPIMVRFLARLLVKKLFHGVRNVLFKERTQWFIACRTRSALRTALTDRQGFRAVDSPDGHFYADPSLFQANGKSYVFFEDFEFTRNRACISGAELTSDGRVGAVFKVLEKDYHLSYPFIFEYHNETYLIPESRARETVELYRAVKFPHKWELVKFLAENVRAVDSTIFDYSGKLWLFTNIAQPGASTFDELHLFYADDLTGIWTPHPKNPIVSDVRRARPAGALFFEREMLVRPSQDCTLRYGRAISFNHVTTLSETDYSEVPIGRIEPDWHRGSICTHTYNRSKNFEVIDGMMVKRKARFGKSSKHS
jgi:hypothetical protein